MLFENSIGFILSKNRRSHSFYVTLQFSLEDGTPRYYRGSYHGNPQEARQDFRRRVLDYQRTHNVRINKIYGLDIRHPYRY